MSVTIMATGDTHIEEGPRFEECKRVLRWFVSEVERLRPAFVAHSGDLHHKTSTQAERLFAAEFVREIAAVCPLILIDGNHCPGELRLLEQLDTVHPVHVIDRYGVVDVAGVAVAGMAWPMRAGQLDDGKAREDIRGTLMALGAELAARPAGTPKVLVGHWMIDGAVTGEGQPLIGGALNVSLSDLGLAGADVVVAGHVHQAQTFRFGETPILYCGSPYRTSFGELEEKSILSLTLEHGQVAVERIPTPAMPMVHVDAAWMPAIGALLGPDGEHLMNPPRDADVRLRFTVDADRREEAQKAAAEIKARWLAAGVASVKIEPQVETTVRTREGTQAVALARTLREKIELFWKSRDNVPAQQRASRLLARLSQLEEAPR